MAIIEDQDRFFEGKLNASMPKHLIGEGTVLRLINAEFVEGAITNAVGFDTLDIKFAGGDDVYVPSGNIKYSDILKRGDIQLAAPLKNTFGQYLILVISGILFQVDLDTLLAYDITPNNASIPEESLGNIMMSYIDNTGGVYGSGGYLVIFNYPNRPIFVNHLGARLSNALAYEMPVSRCGTSGGDRVFVISGDNLMYASDPLGGANPLAPLSFQETLDPTGTYYQQVFSIGSVLDLEYVTCICRMPRLFGASQQLLAQNVLVSTKAHKYIVAAGEPRSTWDQIQFITYAGTSEGIAGPLAVTNIGNSVVYLSVNGRIKLLSQDNDRNESMNENYFDEDVGQYACCLEADYTFKHWYRTLDHSRSILKYNKDRLYATVYPVLFPAKNKFNEDSQTITHKALAIGSLSSESHVGSISSISWSGFYDWFQPVSVVLLEEDIYVIAKNEFGNISYLKENFQKNDEHRSTIITRGYFANTAGHAKSLMRGTLFFRKLEGEITIRISYLVNQEWICGAVCTTSNKTVRFNIPKKCVSDSLAVPLKIEIEHNGCSWELESIRVRGESHAEEK